MPDWFYRTVSQPLLFRMSAVRARDLTLGFMGRLARLPLGPAMIDFLGHMRPDRRLARSFHGIEFPTVIGLGPGVDGTVVALPALARFGFGFLEVGPVTVAGSVAAKSLVCLPKEEDIWFPDPTASLSLETVKPRLVEAARSGLPLIVRVGYSAGATPEQATDECRQLIQELSPHVQLFSLRTADWSPEQWTRHLRDLVDAAGAKPLLLCVPADLNIEEVSPRLDAALSSGVRGFLVDGSVRHDSAGRVIGSSARLPALAVVRSLRRRHGNDSLLIASGGVHEPEDALALRVAGADLIQVDSGLVYTGPGLPKRINEALLFEATRPTGPPVPERPAEMSWFWTLLLGAGMFGGGVLTLLIAATRVVLPYDEAFVGMSRAELAAVNPRLLPFMAHDRVSLAGTMAAIGILYIGLSLAGVRRGECWARRAIFFSAFTGFASFFLFLGFGYLDILHAFVTAALLQLLLLGVHAWLGPYVPETAPSLRGDAAWRRGLWGQLLLVIHGFALLGAGAVIATIGATQVFVPEDLHFMRTTAAALEAANPRLVPLVAHDRATFGGVLLASGWAFLLPALWGFRQGAAWLWWTLLLAGVAGYGAGIGVHFAVCYTDLMHLIPAFAGLAVFVLGMGLSRGYLCPVPGRPP
jgi:dihydroorotate dehydrogenase